MQTSIESLRNAVIQRLELVKLSELWGKEAWTISGNDAYHNSQAASVSVVITLYNYAAYIQQCLDSVCASQTEELPNGFEIVVVNDCSTDHSAQVVQDYLNKRSNIPICLVNKQFNTGLADARNLGLKISRADFVFILDADNWIYPNCLSTLHQAIQGAAAAYGIIRRVDQATGEELSPSSYQDWDVHELIRCPYIDAMAMFDRQILLSVGGYSMELIHHGWFGWEDYDLWLKLAQAGHQARFVAETLSEYRVHAGSMINTTNLYAAAIAEYFRKKFKPLVESYEDFDLLFGYPIERTPSIEEQQAEQIQQLQQQIQQLQQQLQASQQQIQQLQYQLKEVQRQLQETHIQLNQADSISKDRSTQIQHLQQRLQEVQTRSNQQRNELEKRIQQTEAELQFRDLELQFATAGRDQYLGRLQAIESSKFWQLRTQWLLLKNQLLGGKETPFWLPEIPFPRPVRPEPELKAKVVQITQPTIPKLKPQEAATETDYERWQKQHEPRPADYRRMRETVKLLTYQPVISIIVPTYNTPEPFLREAIDSVRNQIYPNWELCIADDASTEPHVRDVLEEYAAKDERIQVIFRQENGHISQSSNSAIELATGEYLALLDHDDVLRPEALYEVVFLLNLHPEADMIYSDEDKIDEVGNRRDPFFKPEWCPDSFLGRMYTCHLGTYRRSIITEIGGFRVGYEGSQDYDLVLRFTEKTDQIFHIPKVLYHWRIHQQSAASGSDAKPYAYIAAKKALADALERRGEAGVVEDTPGYLGHYSIRYTILEQERVSIIIPTKDLGQELNQCLTSIFTKSRYPNYEVILIDNGSVEPYTAEVIQTWQQQELTRFRCYELNIPFNFSKLNNFGVSKATGKYLLFLNNDTEVITPDWIEAMVEQAQRSAIGAVGATLLYPDHKIQHAGVVMGLGALAGHVFSHFPDTSPGYFGQLLTANNYSAVTAACMMCRRDVFEAAGGFNEQLAVALNDIDLCLTILEKGYRNICTPHAVLYHHESKSRGHEDSPEKKSRFLKECEYMKQRWKEIYENDPCYSPHLS
ncbi:MAG: glycosyltransferase, partial [Cyanobacteria bacterium RM1_2_2]|nr:glycosyltransferase [Cyanobacteria bacterium RM1_2_2]